MYADISEQWRNQCEPIKKMSQFIRPKEVGLQKMERCISTQFKVVQYMTQTKQHLKKLFVNPECFAYNRSQAIMTFDQTRVILGEQANRNSPQNYINANMVSICGHNLIATQGPKHNTLQNFWRMIQQHNVVSVFMLCQRTQKGKEKCYMYWPVKDQLLKVGIYEIKLLELTKEKYYKVRKLWYRNTQTNQERQLIQYQFIGWPDGDSPLDKHYKSIIKLLQIMIHHMQNNQMVAVHCSAGVGRTGTFITLAQIKLHIEKNQQFSIFECVRKLRQQRWGMVYTQSQYQYLYDFAENESNRFFQPEKFQKMDQQNDSDS